MNVFFDIDGTLLDDRSATTHAAMAFFKTFSSQLNCPGAAFVSVWEELLHRHFARFVRGEISFEEHRRCRIRELFTQETLSDGEADARFGVYLRCYESHWSLFADVLVCLERLSSMPLGIISNGNSDQQHQKLKRTGILERFSTVVISEEVGASKPEVSQRRLPLQALLGWLQVLSTALG